MIAEIIAAGSEMLTPFRQDTNSLYLTERLNELGVQVAFKTIVGDNLEHLTSAAKIAIGRADIVVFSGGLGPTADDLTAATVGRFQGRPMELDEALSARIAEIVKPLLKRWPNIDQQAIELANRKQATIPVGATVLEPVGTAPGLVVPPAESGAASAGGPTVVVLPGPPRELQPMWAQALETDALRFALEGASVYRQRMLRLFGIPESEIAETLREAAREGVDLERLEITTCLKRGEIEVVTRYEPDAEPVYDAFEEVVKARHADTLFSQDGSSVDDQVAARLRGALTIATAESCTGGLLAARLTDPAGASEYVKGAIVAYSNEVKVSQAGVPAELIEAHGAVSAEVAEALAGGARDRLKADVGVGVTGVAGPGGGTPEKPVGLVWLSVTAPDGARMTRSVNLPGGRSDVRDRATTVAMHLIRRVLLSS